MLRLVSSPLSFQIAGIASALTLSACSGSNQGLFGEGEQGGSAGASAGQGGTAGNAGTGGSSSGGIAGSSASSAGGESGTGGSAAGGNGAVGGMLTGGTGGSLTGGSGGTTTTGGSGGSGGTMTTGGSGGTMTTGGSGGTMTTGGSGGAGAGAGGSGGTGECSGTFVLERQPGTIMFSVDTSTGDTADWGQIRSNIDAALSALPTGMEVGLLFPDDNKCSSWFTSATGAVAIQPRETARDKLTDALTDIGSTFGDQYIDVGIDAAAELLGKRNALGPQSVVLLTADTEEYTCVDADEIRYVGNEGRRERPLRVFPVMIPTTETDQHYRAGRISKFAVAVGTRKSDTCVDDRSCYPANCCHHNLDELVDVMDLVADHPCYFRLPEQAETNDWTLELTTGSQTIDIYSGLRWSVTSEAQPRVVMLTGESCELAREPDAVITAIVTCP